MTAPIIRLPYPHTGQKLVRREAKRRNLLCAGRRWWKTTLGVPIAVETMARGGTVLWGAPTYDQVWTAWEEMCRAIPRSLGGRDQTRMTFSLRGGGRTLFRSLDDPDNARSKTAHGIIVDEAADVEERAIYEVLRPMLLTTNGWEWLIGTPKGRNFLWREYQAILTDPARAADSMAWQIPTLGCRITEHGLVREPHPYENPNIPFEEIEGLYRTLSERRFQQEILAEFIEDAGGVFRGVRKVATGKILPPYAGQFVLGADWGQSNDFTVLVLFDVKKQAIVDMDRFNKIEWAFQRMRLHAMVKRWTDAGARITTVAEANSIGGPNIEALRRGEPGKFSPLNVQPFETTAATKTEIIETLAHGIETSALTLLDDPALVGELEAYEMTRLPGGSMRYGAPSGMHDDCVMATAIAYFHGKRAMGASLSDRDLVSGRTTFGTPSF